MIFDLEKKMNLLSRDFDKLAQSQSWENDELEKILQSFEDRLSELGQDMKKLNIKSLQLDDHLRLQDQFADLNRCFHSLYGSFSGYYDEIHHQLKQMNQNYHKRMAHQSYQKIMLLD